MNPSMACKTPPPSPGVGARRLQARAARMGCMREAFPHCSYPCPHTFANTSAHAYLWVEYEHAPALRPHHQAAHGIGLQAGNRLGKQGSQLG